MPTYEALLQQELGLELTTFDGDAAQLLGKMIVDRAKQEGKALTVTISLGRQTMFHYGVPAHGPNADHWLRRKCNAVYEYHMSSLRLGAKLIKEESSLEVEGRSTDDFTGIGGAVPIIVKGVGVVGAVAVTGMPHVEDHEFVCAALKSLQQTLS